MKTQFWVSALLRRAQSEGTIATVLRHGDDDAGGVVLVLLGIGGGTVLTQTRDGAGNPAWLRAGGDKITQDEIDAYIARAVKRDADLWVVEIENAAVLPFDEKIL